MLKQRILSIIISVAVLIALTACGGTASKAWQEQYDLGVKYLNEGSYEEAILAFTKAIEINPKSAPGYAGRADAYAALAGITEDEVKAKEYYEKAISDYQKAASLGDGEAENKKRYIESLLSVNEESEKASGLLKPLYDCMAEGNYETAVSMLNSSEYKALKNMKAAYLIYAEEPSENKLALYPDSHCYYGGFTGHSRTGNGIWIEPEATEKTKEKHVIWQMYEGAFENDMPNGIGTVIISLSAESQKAEHFTYPLKKEIKGEFKNAVYHGKINQVWYMDTGDVYTWNTINANEGIYERIEGENSSSGNYPISKATTTSGGSPTLYSDGSVQYVFGFEK